MADVARVATVADRQAARLVPVDPDGRVLLLRGIDPARPEEPYWFTVGGALEPDESPAVAAAREAREEVGLAVAAGDLGPPVWSGVAEFSFGGVAIRNVQDHFVVAVDAFEPSRDGLDEEELATVLEARWWPLAELVAHQAAGTGEPVFPPEIGARLADHLAGRPAGFDDRTTRHHRGGAEQ